MSTVISVENVSKAYRLGLIGGKTLRDDLQRWCARARGKPDPLLKIGQKDHGNRDGETVWALRDVSFEVKQGEVLGIIGRNGAGKSTLLKILSQVTAPTTGHIKVKGRIASLLEVGTGFHPELTGRENIFLNGAILGMTRAEIQSKLEEIIAFSGVEKYIDTPVKRYSSGMYVRLAFAVAAHLEPEILVVDEVLAVGDAEFQKKCLGKMGDVAQRGRTVLFVSHNMAAVRSLCARAVRLHSGTLVEDGASEEVISHYLGAGAGAYRLAGSLQEVPRRSDIPGLRFCSYSLLDSAGNAIEAVRLGDPLIVRVVCQAARPVRGVAFGINWFDETGYVINRTTNRTLNMADLEFTTGQAIIDVRYDEVCLLPGAYRVGLALQDSGSGYYDWIDGEIRVQVENSIARPLRLLPGRVGGIVHMPVRFVPLHGADRWQYETRMASSRCSDRGS